MTTAAAVRAMRSARLERIEVRCKSLRPMSPNPSTTSEMPAAKAESRSMEIPHQINRKPTRTVSHCSEQVGPNEAEQCHDDVHDPERDDYDPEDRKSQMTQEAHKPPPQEESNGNYILDFAGGGGTCALSLEFLARCLTYIPSWYKLAC